MGATKESLCKNCGTGKYGTVAGANFEYLCLYCATGFYLENVGAFGISSCTACPLGYAQILKGQAFCLPCTPGKWVNENGTSSCRKCAIGRAAADVARNNECTECDPGTCSAAGSTSCETCAALPDDCKGITCDHTTCDRSCGIRQAVDDFLSGDTTKRFLSGDPFRGP